MKILAAFAVAALVAPAASAQTVSQPANYEGDLTGFHGGPSALPRAIHASEQNGARVMEIRFNNRTGSPGYDVVMERGAAISFVRVGEPAAGVVTVASDTEPRWMLGWRGRKEARAVARAKVDLAQAVRTAERANHDAPAVAAGVASAVGAATATVPAYNVLLLTGDGQTRRVAVDARTGLIIADPAALRGWP